VKLTAAGPAPSAGTRQPFGELVRFPAPSDGA
jgi:hypothetical protein